MLLTSLRGCRRSESEPKISVLPKVQNDSQTTMSGDFWSFSSQKSGKNSKPKIWLKLSPPAVLVSFVPPQKILARQKKAERNFS